MKSITNLIFTHKIQIYDKGSSKLVTAKTVAEFNAIYDEVISVAKIARNIYKGAPAKQDEFSYAKILKKLNAPSRNTEE